MLFDTSRPEGLYVHIPFCATKCPYCDFNTYAGIESQMEPYMAALRSEIDLWGAVLGGPRLDTVFFGGGTPSYLPPGSLGMLLDAVRGSFGLVGDAEITAEANPDDLCAEKLASLLEAGVNRLSIGVQSLDDDLLRLLGRRHSAREALEAFTTARSAGFDNVSIDLMYGLPDQTLEQWGATLATALGMRPSHISMYCLTLEGGTPMERDAAEGRIPVPDGDLAADMYLMAEVQTAEAGYRHYEISNWAIPGRESRHNLLYWRNRPFLGVGPGAHSYLDGHRFHNLRSPREYIRRLESGEPHPQPGGSPIPSFPRRACPVPDTGREPIPGEVHRNTPGSSLSRRPLQSGRGSGERSFDSIPVVEGAEPVDRHLEMAETMMMGLRLDTGIEPALFAARFGGSPGEAYGEVIEELEDDGLLEAGNDRIVLTPRGRLLGNEVFGRFFQAPCL